MTDFADRHATLLNALADRPEAGEVFTRERRGETVTLTDRQDRQYHQHHHSHCTLRLIRGDRLGVGTLTGQGDPLRLLQRTRDLLPYGDRGHLTFVDRLPEASPTSPRAIAPLHEAETWARELGRTLTDPNPDLQWQWRIHRETEQIALATTAGAWGDRHGQRLSLRCQWQRQQEGDLWQGERVWSSGGDLPDYLEVVQELQTAIERSILPLMSWPEGTYPMIFAPAVVEKILIRRAIARLAWPKRDLPPVPFPPSFSLWDRPHQGLDATPWDDEGSPTGDRLLLQGGEIVNFYGDRRIGLAGHGYRPSGEAPQPLLSHWQIAPVQSHTLESLISGCDRGVWVEQILGASQGDRWGGHFRVNLAQGYAIVKGKVQGRLKNYLLEGDCFQWSDTAWGDRGDRWQGQHHLPELWIAAVRLRHH